MFDPFEIRVCQHPDTNRDDDALELVIDGHAIAWAEHDKRQWLEQRRADMVNALPEIAALRKALADYVRHTGIGSTLLPDVKPPSTGTMESETAALRQRVAELERELEAARKEANVAAKKIVAALDKRWPNLNIEGWDNEEAADIVAAVLAAYRATQTKEPRDEAK